MILKFVEETIDGVLKLFKYSAVHQSQFQSQLQSDGLVEVYEKGTKLIHYHKICWTSYNEYVKRVNDLFNSLSSYLQKSRKIWLIQLWLDENILIYIRGSPILNLFSTCFF